MEEKIKEVAQSMYEGIVSKQKEDNTEWVHEMIEKHTPEKLSSIRYFESFVNSKLETQSFILFETLYENGFIKPVQNSKDKTRLGFIYYHYKFLKRQLGTFIREVNGFSCSQDKVGFILDSYSANLRGEEVEWDTTKFWVPDAGTFNQWIELVDSTMDLYYAIDYGERRLGAMKSISAEYAKLNSK